MAKPPLKALGLGNPPKKRVARWPHPVQWGQGLDDDDDDDDDDVDDDDDEKSEKNNEKSKHRKSLGTSGSLWEPPRTSDDPQEPPKASEKPHLRKP